MDASAIWSVLYNRGTPHSTYYLGDYLTADIYWGFNEDTASGSAGFGVKTPGGSWNWYSPSFHQVSNGYWEWKFTSDNTVQFTTTGNHFYAGRFAYWWGTTYADNNYTENDFTLSESSYFAVNALNNPTSVSLSGESTSAITVNWARSVSGNTKDTIVVRHTSSAITNPTQGTSYSTSNSTGGGTVVYKGNATTFTDTGLNSGTTYYYKVYAENWSYYSSGVALDTATVPSAPAAPTSASVATTSFTANWTAPSGGATTSYRLDVDDNVDFSSPLSSYNNKTVSGTSDPVTGLSPNTTYYVRVRAVSDGGTSTSSATLTQVTLANAPAAPTLSAATTSGFSVAVNANSNPSTTEFAIRVGSNYVQSNGTLGATAAWQTATAWGTRTVTGLSVNSSYTVDVKARNGAGTETAFGASASITTLANAPTAPTLSAATTGGFSVAVNANSNPSTTEFAIRVGSNYVQSNGTLGATAAWQTATAWGTRTVTGLSVNTSYTVDVKARNGANTETAFGASASVTTLANVPGAPTLSSATTGGFSIAVNANSNPATTQFAIRVGSDYVQANGLLGATAVWQTAATWGTRTVTGLSSTTQYTVDVKARNGANVETAFGTSANITTLTPSGSITTSGSLTAMSSTYGTASTAQNFTVSGSDLSGDLTVTAPNGFEVSTSSSTTGFGATATLSPSGGSLTDASVWVRLAARSSVAGSPYSGNVAVSGGGAPTQNVATASSTVSAKALTITGVTASNKVYDRTTAATLDTASAALSGVESGDAVTLSSASATGSFADKTVGTGKAVTSSGFAISGDESSNYSLTQPATTADITQAPLTITGVTASNKVYDRTTTAALNTGSAALSGVVSGDTVTLSSASAAGSFADKAVGTGKTVTTSGFAISGADAGNYSLTQPSTTANITQAPLTITGVSASNKTYDGNTTATLDTASAALSGVISGDTVTLSSASATGTFANATVDSGKTVTTSGFAIAGADSGNYSLTQPSPTADITAKALTVTASNVSKTYGSALTGGSGSTAFTASGLVGSETIGSVTITYTGTPSGALAATAAGTYNGTVVPSAATGGTFSASNYSITYTAGNVTVDKAVLTVTAANQTVGTGTPAATVTGNGSVSYTGFVNGEDNSVVSGSVTYTTTYTSSDAAGTAGRTITPVVTGLSATNYSFTAVAGTITVASPTYGMRDDGGTNLPRLTYWYAGAPADVTERGDQFGGRNLGNITSLFLKGANIKTYKNGAGDVTGTRFEYKIWREGTAEPASFTTQSVGFTSNDGDGSQTWSSGFSEINVFSAGSLGTNYGTYNVKIQFTVQGSGVAGKVTEGPYTATFTHQQPASITIDGSTAVTASAFTTTYGSVSTAQTFAIVGASLTADITATAPTGFEVSSNGSSYGSTATFTQTSGAASGTLYLRLASTAAANGTYNSQTIALSSAGATTRNITTAATGNTVSKATPSISAAPTASSSIIKGDALYNGLLTGGTASTAGTFAFDDTSSEQTASGSQAVTFTPTDSTNFNTAATTVNVTVDPVPDPTNVTATSSGTTSIALTHDLTSSKNVMIVRRAGSAVTFTPDDNTNYNNGQNLGDGHVVLHGSLAANTSSDTGLDPSTTYHYKIFSENWGWYSAGVATSATTDALPPTITVTGSPGAMTTNYGTASAAENFTVSGTNLSASLSVAAPAGFEVSESSGSGYGSAVTLTPSSGSVASTTIYVRLKSNASPGANSGNITLASTGATSQTVAVSGTVNVASMSMTINSPAGSMNADYTTSKLFADELAGTANNVTITFSPGLTPDEVEVWTNLNNRERADDDANSDGIPDGIIPPDPPTDKPVGYTSGVYPTDGYFQAHPMSGSAGTYTLTINANKTGAYRLTARYRMNGGPWVYYNYGGKRDHAITVTPILARNMNVYEVNVLNINATGDTFQTRSTFEDLTDTNSTRVNLDYLRNMGVNTLWFQPIHPNGVEGREPSGGWDTATSPYDPGSPYAVKNFFEVMEIMTDSYNGSSSVAANRAAAMSAFTNFVAQADTKGVHVMLDAPFNHTAYDVELAPQGLELLAAAGVSTTGWSATDKIKDREARFFSRNDGANAYAGPASSAANIAPAPDRNDFGKWRDVLDVFFGRYSALVEGNPSSGAALNKFKNESDAMEYGDLTGGANSAGAVTRAVWEYFARYVPYWLEQTGLPAGSSAAEQAYKGVDGLRADFGQGMPPQFWEYVINVAREHKWNFVFMSESLDGGEVTYRSNRHFDILNENIVFPWQQAGNTTAHRTIFEDRRAAYGQGLVLLNNTSHDEAGYADPWQAFIRYAVGSTIDGAPMIMYGQEIGTGASLSFSHYEVNFGKSIPHFKRYNSMNPQWLAWGNNTLGVRNLMPNYSGVGLAREFSAALRSSNRWFLNPINTLTADPDIFAVAKYETANASPSNSDVVLAFVNLNRNSAEANTFGIPAGLGALLGIEANKYYNVKNIAAYLGPNNELNGRRDNFLWETPRLGSDILANGIYVAMNPVPSTDGAWSTAPYEVQYLKVYAAPSISVSGSPSALSATYGAVSANTSFTLSGSDVHDGMTVTAPAGFQVSTNASTGFADSITLTDTGTLGSTTIYVRLGDNNAVGSYSGNVTISSPGGNNTTVAVPSSTVNQKALTVGGATATGRAYDGTTSVAVSGGELVGVVGGDEVTLSTGSASGAVATATAGAGKAVAVTGYTIGGGDAANYTLTQPTDVTVTISKATPTITAAPTAGAIAEGQALSDSTLTGGSATGVGGAGLDGTFAFTSSATIPAAGTASHSVTFTPTDSTNYNTTTAMVSVNAGLAADFSVDFVDGAYVIKDGGGTPLAGVSYTYSYSGRSVGGLTQAYSFLSYSSSTAPTAPGYYTVQVTAAGNYIGALSEPFAIAGPLALPNGQAIEATKTAGVTTVRFNRATLLGNLQRVVNDADGTLATGATGLTWTATTAGLSQMPMGYDPATIPNTVTYSGSFVTLTPPGGGASTSDSFTLTVSDGVTPLEFPVTVTSTAAPTFDLQIRKLVPIDGDPTNMKAIFLTRPNRTVELEFFSTTDGEFVPVRDKEAVVSADTQNSLTTMVDGNTVERPPDQISTGASGVLELKVPAAHSSMSFRAKPVTAPQQ